MIAKTLSGVCFLDDLYGGVYAGRSFLVSGRSGTGKSTLGFQFARQGLQQDERCLILSTMAANDLSILAEALGFSFAVPIDEGNLVLLEYQSFIPGKGISEWGTLPPEGFSQLKEIIEANAVKRVVLDTVLPWIAMPKQDRLAEHIFSFVRSCDRLGVTTMMTIPKPVSSMAFRLKKALEEVTPISILLNTTDQEGRFTWQAVKYLGEKKPSGMVSYSIVSRKGLVPYTSGTADAAQAQRAPVQSDTPPPPSPATSSPPSTSKRVEAVEEHVPVRFSSVVRASPSGGLEPPPPRPQPRPAVPEQSA
ncbi:MAG: hypothetical protein JJU05_18875 [Verrucomicrobia bacterium]|nr:hypothetical protein [Verrucomicrobiota bacterium]MCH8525980.1 hypothetical protein [Kiritimatiellia bacterium]